ncbi:hypothetical protein CRM22_006813 [Opisthorchis felineus]|uniref:EGF-like domain-containing protein n=1 Tax=Opisthorchis felineus TaxID=147828 RepID=A0A4S2LJA3_OPIFE|nr:hypothetical protein CRM22_006813 [Opisthorchis felineus]
MLTVWSTIIVNSMVFSTCFLLSSTEAAINYLTENRPRDIKFLFTHFTPFEDMNHPESRSQRMGLQTQKPFSDRSKTPVWLNTVADLTIIIKAYIEAGIAIHGAGNTTEVNMELSELMRKVLTFPIEDGSFFLFHLLNPISKFSDPVYKDFYDDFREEMILTEPVNEIKEPMFMYGMRAWKAFYLVAFSSNPSLFVKADSSQYIAQGYQPPSTIHDAWSLVFIDEYCRIVRKNYSDQIQIPNGFCPDPCMTQPCVGLPHTSSAKCVPTGTLWYEYKCSCQPNYKWTQPPKTSGHCQTDDTCSSYCDPVGTRRCDVVDNKQFCVCRPTHMGPTCSKLRNPCLELSSPNEVPGNTSCNAANGGKCIGVPGTNTYSCICPPAYTSDASYPLPNCLAFRDSCMGVICLQGDCISSKDGQETYCNCPDEAYGDQCELVRGKWAQWSPWSECTPNCGVSEYQRRVRTRDCLGEACRGGEGHLQMEMCSLMPCPDETLALARQGRWEEPSELKIQMLQAQAARCVKLVGAIAEALILISCVFSCLTATAMVFSVYFM